VRVIPGIVGVEGVEGVMGVVGNVTGCGETAPPPVVFGMTVSAGGGDGVGVGGDTGAGVVGGGEDGTPYSNAPMSGAEPLITTVPSESL
jgi:hypothetical protein